MTTFVGVILILISSLNFFLTGRDDNKNPQWSFTAGAAALVTGLLFLTELK